MEPEKKEMFVCPHCKSAFNDYRSADHCIFRHIKERCINNDFEHGYNLRMLNHSYSLNLTLTKKMEAITKDSCFTISYLQCGEKPSYRIKHIDYAGRIEVGGVGSWSGYYSSIVDMHCLTDPRPKEELFIDPRAGR